MISLTCTNCREVLTIDDAFAGGVCRCQHCGTIQTVPSRLRGGATPKPTKVDPATKTLYRRSGTADSKNPGTGLDELAEVVASSGLLGSGSGLSSARLRGAAPASSSSTSPPPRSLAPW